MKGRGTLSTDLVPQHGREVELSYANVRKDKVKSRYNLARGLNGIFGRDMITELYPIKVIQQLVNCYIQG